MRAFTTSVLIAILAVGCTFGPKRFALRFASEIDTASRLAGPESADEVRENLTGSQWNWKSAPAYSYVRARARELKLRQEVLVEIGNRGNGSYEVIWIGSHKDVIVALSKIGRSSHVVEVEFEPKRWEEFLQRAGPLSQGFKTCKSDLGLSDASSYFGELGSGPGRSAFAVYGLAFLTAQPAVSEERRQASEAMAPCKTFVELVLQLVALHRPGTEVE